MEGSFAVTDTESRDVGLIIDDNSHTEGKTLESDDTEGSPVATSKKTTRKTLKKKKRPLRKLDGAILKQRIRETQKKIQLLLEKTESLQVKLRTHEEEATLRNA